jgi:hypothetical protein
MSQLSVAIRYVDVRNENYHDKIWEKLLQFTAIDYSSGNGLTDIMRNPFR